MSATGAELGRPFEDVTFSSSDGVELHGWFFPASASSARGSLAILICHGNAGNICHRLEMCEVLLETGAGVFLFDYRGYGRSAGRPSDRANHPFMAMPAPASARAAASNRIREMLRDGASS